MKKRKAMNEEIKTITEKFVKELSPLKVYLFGSYARGNFTSESDYDFYILMPDSYNVTNDTSAKAYLSLRGLKRKPVDIVINTQQVFTSRSNLTNTLENTVKKEGLILYEK